MHVIFLGDQDRLADSVGQAAAVWLRGAVPDLVYGSAGLLAAGRGDGVCAGTPTFVSHTLARPVAHERRLTM